MILLSSDAALDVERVRSFLKLRNPDAAKRALRRVWRALELVEQLPDLGQRTKDRHIRQLIVRFGDSAYIVRYRYLQESQTVFVTRIWHGREARE
jgi:plasmid stabilization system protein ParE